MEFPYRSFGLKGRTTFFNLRHSYQTVLSLVTLFYLPLSLWGVDNIISFELYLPSVTICTIILCTLKREGSANYNCKMLSFSEMLKYEENGYLRINEMWH